jgi:PAS domain S-box-containing protein
MENKEQILHKISEISPSLIYVCNIEGGTYKTTYLNKKIREVVGVSSEDHTGKETPQLSSFIHPEDLQNLREHHRELTFVADGNSLEIEFRIHAEGDGWRWLRSKETVFSRDSMGKVSEILGVAQDITEIKLASSLLHKNEEMFKLVFDQSPFGAAILNNDFKFLKANRSFCKMLKYDEQELLFKKANEVSHPDDWAKDIVGIRKLMAGDIDVYATEKRYITKDKDTVWGKVTLRLTRDDAGEPKYFFPVIEDITEEKALQEREKESRSLLETAGKTAKFGGWKLDLKTKKIWWSEQVAIIHERPVGYSPILEEGINYYAPEWRDKITQLVNDCSTKGIPYDSELEIITAKGKRLWIRATGEAAKNDAGEIIALQGSFQDITEVVEKRQKIMSLEDFIEKLLKTSNAIIVELDTEGNLKKFNAAAAEITGYKEEEVLGKSWFDTIVPEDKYPEIRKEFERLMAGGIPVEMENPIITKKGEERYVKWRNSQLFDDDKLIGTLSFGVEITDHKKLENEMTKQLETTERLNKLLLDREVRMSELKEEIKKLKGVLPV